MGPVRTAIRAAVVPGQQLHTPARNQPFVVSEIDERGVELLLGAKEARTRFSWECLEGVLGYLAGRGWVIIGSAYDTGARAGTLDAYLKQHVNRATAGWIAALLEQAGVVDIDRSRPARVQLQAGFGRTEAVRPPSRSEPLQRQAASSESSARDDVGSTANGEVGVSVRFRWQDAGRVETSADRRLAFPELPARPGVYRLAFRGGEGSRVYVGEAADLRRRMRNYRNPGSTQQTSLRVNGLLLEHLAGGGTVRLSITFTAETARGHGWELADMSNKNLRRLAEQAAIAMENAEELHNR